MNSPLEGQLSICRLRGLQDSPATYPPSPVGFDAGTTDWGYDGRKGHRSRREGSRPPRRARGDDQSHRDACGEEEREGNERVVGRKERCYKPAYKGVIMV